MRGDARLQGCRREPGRPSGAGLAPEAQDLGADHGLLPFLLRDHALGAVPTDQVEGLPLPGHQLPADAILPAAVNRIASGPGIRPVRHCHLAWPVLAEWPAGIDAA